MREATRGSSAQSALAGSANRADRSRMRRIRCADATYRTPAASAPQNGSRVIQPLLRLAPPPDERDGRADEAERVDAEDDGRSEQREHDAGERGADRSRTVDGHTAQPGCEAIWLRGTSSGWIDCHAGLVSAEVAPMTKVKSRSSHGVRSFAAETTVSPTATTALTIEPQIRRLAPVERIGEHPGGQREQKGWREARGLHERDDGRTGRTVDQVPLGADCLHPGADVRPKLGDPQHPEHRIASGAQGEISEDFAIRSTLFGARAARRD